MIYGLIGYTPLRIGDYDYPMWANVFGWMMAGSSMACIPIGAVIMIFRYDVRQQVYPPHDYSFFVGFDPQYHAQENLYLC